MRSAFVWCRGSKRLRSGRNFKKFVSRSAVPPLWITSTLHKELGSLTVKRFYSAPVVVPNTVASESKVAPNAIFSTVWDKLLKKCGGVEKMLFPKEIIFLMGAPGSGKGTNTPFILKARGITEGPIVVSDLLDAPELKPIKESAGLVSDEIVCQLLLECLLNPKYKKGVVVDGFPRTPTQVELVRLLYENMLRLHKNFKDSVDHGRNFSRPIFRVTVLYVEGATSVERQLARGKLAIEHNVQVEQSGSGSKLPVRPPDFDPEAARQRYKTFQKHYDTLLSLQKHFHFNIINASGSIEEVQMAIQNEFYFQAKMELDSETYDLVSQVKNTEEITRHSRQELVQRLDTYANWNKFLFEQVLKQLKHELYPAIELNSLSGRCVLISTAELWHNEAAKKIALDILAERGFRATVEIQEVHLPVKVDRETFRVVTERQTSFKFYLTWVRPRFLALEHD